MTLAILLCCTGVNLSAQAAEDDFSQPCPVIENGVCLFKVVYPQDGDKVTVDSAKAIQKALEEKSGGKVTLSVDEGRPGKVYDSDALEILVGQTGHPEAAQAQAREQARVKSSLTRQRRVTAATAPWRLPPRGVLFLCVQCIPWLKKMSAGGFAAASTNKRRDGGARLGERAYRV